ncbi:MAG: magnesium transporter [Candidatus Omnitrophota bacterium]|nr:magnesium transporter [Candidatus Omnitrophota bacterium]MBU2528883.1 magnesium transporter [bacterium]MBU3930006.1 magnesium transporter [bacterium]MBU4123347.1 magnesium transporter [bacterium]
MLKELLKPEIEEMIAEKAWHSLKNILIEWPEADIADLLKNLEDKEAIVLFMLLPKQLKAETFAELDPEKQTVFLKRIGDEVIRDIVLELSPDDRTELFEELPGRITKKLLNFLPPAERKETLKLLGYPEDSVGRLMTPDYVAIRPEWTVRESLEHIREFGHDAETVNRVYVIDKNWHLLDDISLRKLILADLSNEVSSLMDRNFIAVSPFDDQEVAVTKIKKYDLFAIPVVDSENVLLGIVTVDDVLDVFEEEVTEDVHKAGGIVPLEMSYSAASSSGLYKKRVGWLLLFLASGFVSSMVITYFEGMLAKVVALAAFIPVMMGEGGNIGNQASVLIVRALALGELTTAKWFNIMKKELAIGILLGLTLGVAIGLWGYLWKGDYRIGLVVGSSMLFISLWANLLGSALPIVLTKFKMDPAIICGSLLMTVIDTTGLMIYFSIAGLLLF